MTQALDLVLPGFVPDSRLSLNGRNRTHWRTIRNLRDQAELWMNHALSLADVDQHFDERVSVDVTFVYPTSRRRDPDGLAGLAKPLLDSLVRWAVIEDDDSTHVELSVRALTIPKTTETRITIKPAQIARERV